MATWQRIANVGAAVSAIAALIAAGTAVTQVQSTNKAMDDLLKSYQPLFEQMVAETSVDDKVLLLRPLFESINWRSISIEDLWTSSVVQGFGMSEDEFLVWLNNSLDRGFLRQARCFPDDLGCNPYEFEWDPSMRLPSNL